MRSRLSSLRFLALCIRIGASRPAAGIAGASRPRPSSWRHASAYLPAGLIAPCTPWSGCARANDALITTFAEIS